MRIDCRLFAVSEVELQELRTDPALVLGRSLLAGDSLCDLKDVGPALRLLLADPEQQAIDHALLAGGTKLHYSDDPGTSPRLLSVGDVKGLHASLISLTEPELQRRFNDRNLVSAVLERISTDMMGFSDQFGGEDADEDHFPASEADFAEDWTLDQADEFERIAQQVEDLREFVSAAARKHDVLLIAVREAE